MRSDKNKKDAEASGPTPVIEVPLFQIEGQKLTVFNFKSLTDEQKNALFEKLDGMDGFTSVGIDFQQEDAEYAKKN